MKVLACWIFMNVVKKKVLTAKAWFHFVYASNGNYHWCCRIYSSFKWTTYVFARWGCPAFLIARMHFLPLNFEKLYKESWNPVSIYHCLMTIILIRIHEFWIIYQLVLISVKQRNSDLTQFTSSFNYCAYTPDTPVVLFLWETEFRTF